jgi:PHD/YefM family antitoxin component YafN of YafNO toxin-antitoxin module
MFKYILARPGWVFEGKEKNMEEVNALKIRNNLGKILDRLNKSGEPILISKNRKIRAVLVTPEQFERRFLDWQAQDKRRRFLAAMKQLKKSRKGNIATLDVLRKLRGYDQ